MSTVPRVQCTTISSLRSNVPPNPWILCTTPWSNVQLSLGSNVPPLRFNVPSCTTNIPLWSNVLYVVPCEQLTRIIDYHHRLPSPINATNQSPSSRSIVDHQFNHVDQDHRLLSPMIETITKWSSFSNRSITDPITWPRSSITDSTNWYRSQFKLEEEEHGLLHYHGDSLSLVIGERMIIMVKWCSQCQHRFTLDKWYRVYIVVHVRVTFKHL